MIARTEALHAANMGGRLAIEQVIEDGNTSGFDVERTWLADQRRPDPRQPPRAERLQLPHEEATGLDLPKNHRF